MGEFSCKKNQRIIEKNNKHKGEILELFQLCRFHKSSYKNKIIENEEAF